MKKALLIICLSLVATSLIAGSCDNTPITSQGPGFKLIFKYGVGAKNVLDTFAGTYTKDMIIDPSITIPLALTEAEKTSIYQKMVEIDFFSYPDVFKVDVPPGGQATIVTPHTTYYFKVEYDSRVKELKWEDEIVNPDERATRLKTLINFIQKIIESRDEYKKLPEARGGYL